MKKLMTGMAIAAAVVGISLFGTTQEAKADSRTLHGVADIIFATGTLVNSGYNTTTVYYEPYPVFYERHYYPVRTFHHRDFYRGYRNPRSYNHCY